MPFERHRHPLRRIAVIGGGISGLGAAHLLAHDHRVVLYEAEDRPGGHARTILAGKNGDQPVDTGFIVFNQANYPRLLRLFRRLGVPMTKSNMSFSASINGGELEYALTSIDTIFAQRRNLLRPRYLRMLRDILKFNARAVDAAKDPDLTIGELMQKLGLSEWFRRYYLAPLSGAIWSTPVETILEFPARALVQFFNNHALMGFTGQHQWYTVHGGSVEYVTRLCDALAGQAVDIRLNTPVHQVRRRAGGVDISARDGSIDSFDEVVFATHSDDTLRLLADPSPMETAHLDAIRYQPNEAILHADPSVMPQMRKCWSSWNYTEERGRSAGRIDLTYWMNSLQPIPHDDPMFVTLNAQRTIREDLIYDVTTFRHPLFDLAALRAQQELGRINGRNHTWFCGAWMKNGFHEDGYVSACDVAARLGAVPEWA